MCLKEGITGYAQLSFSTSVDWSHEKLFSKVPLKMCHLAVEDPSTRYYISNFPLKLSLSCLHSTNFITREGETLFLLERGLSAASLWMKKKGIGDIYANSWTKQNFDLSDLSKADTHHAWITTLHPVYQRHTVW